MASPWSGGWLDRRLGGWFDGSLDLFLGSRCSACRAPGRALCRRCALGLTACRPAPAWPTPTPAGLAPPVAAGEYADVLRALVVEHKEHGRLALAAPLGRLLASSVRFLTGPAGRVVLVPVPSTPAVVRARGQDPLLRVTRAAATELRRDGVRVQLLPLLRVDGRPADQAGLDADARARNLRGRFVLRPGAAPPPGGPVVLVDDVITTGATAREAQRALEAGGVGVLGVALVAATRRRWPSLSAGLAPSASEPQSG